ncbi:hypothetical protein DCAR_0314354 [Daucus carota subsp. sativus]|uniref:Uncharacterized protein n=1 Tax=Daucus carota subsp. sativus TaxID=79200 RepID=A0A169WIE5_DAUCS|nr:hypothetical protein DCAR_0314354 [Daucus carota subsp. sativus]
MAKLYSCTEDEGGSGGSGRGVQGASSEHVIPIQKIEVKLSVCSCVHLLPISSFSLETLSSLYQADSSTISIT